MTYKFADGISLEKLRGILDYDADTGLFTRKVARSSRCPVGSLAGTVTRHGYVAINIDGARVFAHRLAWLHVYGVSPAGEIDHINRVRSDNRISNLRQADRALNTRNNGALGYHVNASGSYVAALTVNRKAIYLGSFRTAEDARAAYLSAREIVSLDLR